MTSMALFSATRCTLCKAKNILEAAEEKVHFVSGFDRSTSCWTQPLEDLILRSNILIHLKHAQ